MVDHVETSGVGREAFVGGAGSCRWVYCLWWPFVGRPATLFLLWKLPRTREAAEIGRRRVRPYHAANIHAHLHM